MAKATMKGLDCEVRVTRDFSDTWAVEVAPVLPEPRKWETYKPFPARLVVKLHAASSEGAAKGALELLKQQKAIDDYIA